MTKPTIDTVFTRLNKLQEKAQELMSTTVVEEAKAKEFQETVDMMVDVVKRLADLRIIDHYDPVSSLIEKAKEIVPRLEQDSEET